MKTKHFLGALAGLAVALAAGPLWAADNFTPSNSVNTYFKGKDVGATGSPLVMPYQIPSDITGTALFSSTNPGTVTLGGQLPAFAATPTVNVGSMPTVTLAGSLPGFATPPSVVVTTMPSVTLTGTLPAFASVPGFNLAQVGGVGVTLGQKTSAQSLPVVLPSDQVVKVDGSSVVQPVSGAVSLSGSLPAFAATPTINVGTMPSVTLTGTLPAFASTPGFNLAQVGGTAVTLGTKTSAASVPVTLSSDGNQATATAQATGNTSLATIATNTAGVSTAANQLLLNTANGTPADVAYNGSNTASEIALLKALYGQAAPTSVPGTTISSTTPVPGVQGVTGGVALGVDTVVHGTAAARSLILPVQESGDTVAAAGSGGTTGDILTVVGGTLTPANAATGVAAGTPAKCTATYTSGALTACVPLAGSLGSYTVLPTNPVATTSSGAGTGSTLNVTWTGLAIQLALANTSRRGLHVQPQGGVAYLRGAGVTATADYNALKISADALYETSPAFVGTGALSIITAGSVPLPVYASEF